MKVTKNNRINIYKHSKGGKVDVFINVDGVNYKTTVFPNIEDDLTVRSWGGNLFLNEEDEDE